jgi:hypothetical protein
MDIIAAHLVLLTLAIGYRGTTGMSLEEVGECTWVVEIEAVGYFTHRHVGPAQINPSHKIFNLMIFIANFVVQVDILYAAISATMRLR